jgi:hypothetical protein
VEVQWSTFLAAESDSKVDNKSCNFIVTILVQSLYTLYCPHLQHLQITSNVQKKTER